MTREELLARLNWFYSLELNQVDLYAAQGKRQPDIYLARALERIAVIEQQHVDNIAERIRELGGSPTRLGDVLAPILGRLAGEVSARTDPQVILKMNITLEEKAMRDYKDLLLQVGPRREVFDTLWANLIDEDLHTAWFASKLKELAMAEAGRG